LFAAVSTAAKFQEQKWAVFKKLIFELNSGFQQDISSSLRL
jgi:hypothetical protein